MEGPHGLGCRSTTVRLRCRDCGQEIYLLRCNHGSAVLFDALGGAWPVHDAAACERAWGRALPRSTDDGVLRVEVTDGVSFVADVRRSDWEPDPDTVVDTARRAPRTADAPVLRVDPPPSFGGAHTVVGRVRELLHERDVLGRLGLRPGSVGARELPVAAVASQLTVVVDTGEDGDALESYTTFADRDLLGGVRHGIDVLVDLVVATGAGGRHAWCAEDLLVL